LYSLFAGLRTPLPIVFYALYLRFLGDSLRKVSKAVEFFTAKSHVAVWRWEKKLRSFRNVSTSRCRVSAFLIDDTEVRVSGYNAWVFIAYELFEKKLLGMWLSWTKNQLVAEKFLGELIGRFGKHPVYSDGGYYYAASCKSLSLDHRVYSFGSWIHQVVKSIICTRIKDATRIFEYYFPCRRKNCNLEHVWSWMPSWIQLLPLLKSKDP